MITKEMWKQKSGEHEGTLPLTKEEEARWAEFAQKMKALSKEELEALLKKAQGEDAF